MRERWYVASSGKDAVFDFTRGYVRAWCDVQSIDTKYCKRMPVFGYILQVTTATWRQLAISLLHVLYEPDDRPRKLKEKSAFLLFEARGREIHNHTSEDVVVTLSLLAIAARGGITAMRSGTA